VIQQILCKVIFDIRLTSKNKLTVASYQQDSSYRQVLNVIIKIITSLKTAGKQTSSAL
jgi:hypothetical protein